MTLRPTNPKKITVDDLLPGDVILSAGATNPANPKSPPPSEIYIGLLDYLIKTLDGGDYTHTSLYTGKSSDGIHQVVEATAGGIVLAPLSADLDSQVLVDAYRYTSPDGHKLGDSGWPAKPIIDQAMTFIGAPYAYSELLMGAIILLRVVNTPPGAEQLLLELAARGFEAELESWIDSLNGTKPMTCVQVATTSYYQAKAEPAHKYALQIKLTGNRVPPDPAGSSDTFAELKSRLQALLKSALPEVLADILSRDSMEPGAVLTAGSDLAPLGTCTPHDMETSPTLSFVGCLEDSRTA